MASAYLQAEVPGWADRDDVRVAALFKAFSGQREDWQARLDFWKSLITDVARHLDVFIVDAREVQQQWFLRGGLLPLCLNDVMHEMLNSGELQRMDEFMASSIRPSVVQRIFSGLGHALVSVLGLRASPEEHETVISGKLLVFDLLKERVSQLIKDLAETNWKSECLLTLQHFVALCGSVEEARAVMHHLVVNRSASHLYIDSEERIEGLKISLVEAPVSALSEADYNMLQLHWTQEKLQQRLDALEQQATRFRESAIKSVRSNDKQSATRYLKLRRITAASRDNCYGFLEKIHRIIEAISDAEATKKVSEAIQIGSKAMKEQHVTLDEVEEQLRELDESILVGKEVAEALDSNVEEDDELEAEYAELEAEMVPDGPTKAAPAAASEGPNGPQEADDRVKTGLNSAEASLEVKMSRMELIA